MTDQKRPGSVSLTVAKAISDLISNMFHSSSVAYHFIEMYISHPGHTVAWFKRCVGQLGQTRRPS